MPNFIQMPKSTDTMTEGTLAKWLKKVGDQIEVGDVVAEIETDKATMELQAFDEGILAKIYVSEGEKVPVQATLAVLVEEGEEAPDAPPDSAPAPPEEAESDGGREANTEPSKEERDEDGAAGGRVKASPLARKLAKDKGVNLVKIKGTGPGGRVVKVDVLSATPDSDARSASTFVAPATIRAQASGEDKKIPLSGMRTVIAERLLASKTQIPHFYLTIDVDAGPLMALREQINNSQAEGGNKFTVNDFILKAVVAAAVAEPRVNASFAGDHIIQFADVNLAVAVAVEDGLVTPIIRAAQHYSLLDLSLAVKDLAGRARNKKLAPNEFQGGTITVSNLGSYGIESFDAIINPPQAAILSISAIRKVPVVNQKDEIVPGLRMKVGLSGDHRVVDGAVAAEYLGHFRKLIENPALMLF